MGRQAAARHHPLRRGRGKDQGMTEAAASLPADMGLAIHIAHYHLARRNLDAAHAALIPHMAAPPQDERQRQALSEACSALALAYVARRQTDLAAEAVAQARSLAEQPAAWRAAAAVATLQGDTVAAEALWRQVTAAERDNPAGWLSLARACEAAGKPLDASAAYLEAERV